MSKSIKTLLAGLAGATFLAASAQAGGFSRGTADTDILYEDGNFVARSSVSFVIPTQNLSSQGFVADSGNLLESYVIPNFAFKLQATDSLACAGTFTTPFGGSTNYGGTTAGLDVSTAVAGGTRSVSQEFITNELGLTCSYAFDVGPGQFHIIGGGYHQSLDFEQQLGHNPALGGIPTLALRLNANSWGYRVGAAYEIPEIALRAQLMYRSETEISATGSLDNLVFGVPVSTASYGAAKLPQSVELKVQSGVAPGWLVFGDITWTQWSVLQVLQYNATGLPGADASLNFYWRDGWTVNVGVAHQLTEAIALAGSVGWDRGVGTGHDLSGSDIWRVGLGASIKPNSMVEFRGGIGASFFGAASQDFSADPATGVGAFTSTPGVKTADSGHAIGFNLGAKIKF